MQKNVSKKLVVWILSIAVIAISLEAIINFQPFKNGLFSFNSDVTIGEKQSSLFGKNKHSKEIDLSKSESLVGIKSIVISSVSPDIKLIPSEDNTVNAHLFGKSISSAKDYNPKLEINKSGDELSIKVVMPEHTVLFLSNDLNLEIQLPKSYSNILKVESASASLDFDTLKLTEFEFKSVSGDMHCNSIDAQKIVLNTASGKFTLSGICKDFLFNSISGDLEAKDMTSNSVKMRTASGFLEYIGLCKKDFYAKSISGDITCEDLGTESAQVETTSGKVLLTELTGNLISNSVSGDLDAKFSKLQNNIKIGSISGRSLIQLPSDSKFNLNFNSASGNIDLDDFDRNSLSTNDDNNMKVSIGNSDNNVIITTVSGDCKIFK